MGRIYYGWRLVAVAFVVNMVAYGATYQAFQVFVLPASKAFGLTRAEMNTAMVLFSVGSAVAAPFLGRLVDFVSPKRVIVAGVLLLGACFAALGLSRSVWLSAAVFALPLGAAVLCAAQLALPLLLNRWFTAQRGRAMALALMGISIGQAVMVPLVALLIGEVGWRAALLVMSVVLTALLLVLVLPLRERPEPGELESAGAAGPSSAATPPDAAPLQMGRLLRMPQFWTITLSNALAAGMATAFAVSLFPLAVAKGLNAAQAATLVSVTGLASLGAKVVVAAIADRISRIVLLTAVYGLAVPVNLALLAGDGFPVLVGCALALGVAQGAFGPLLLALIADRFGPSSFGTVSGLSAPFTLVASALAMRFAGGVFDRTGSYDLMHQAFIGLALGAAALMYMTQFTRGVGPDPKAAPATMRS